MSVIIGIHIPRRLREKMDSLGNINWSEEVRRFLEERVEELHRRKVLEEVHRVVEQLPEVPREIVTRYVRKDRDSHWCFSTSKVPLKGRGLR